ncbi:MAG TPA: response regulator [Flavitalea sp.]|nr:response regulator [Flavitalea sp.]
MKHILHADDNESDRWAFKYLIHNLEPTIDLRSFPNGLELAQYLETMKEEIPETIIFIDLEMPIWDGIKTLKALQREPKYANIPIYIWSSAESKNEKNLCLKLGAKDFLSKPVKPEEWETAKETLKMIINK